MNIDERLKNILSEIDATDKVADIGCDHGKVANLAVRITNNPVFAVDISEQSLRKAKELAIDMVQEDLVICIKGDGLKPLINCDIDTIVIAGLGGHEIIKILDETNTRYKKYILVPHQHAGLLRKFLMDNDYLVAKDYVIECQNKLYPIIVAGIGHTTYSDFELMFGKTRTDAQQKLIDKQKKILLDIVKSASGDNLLDAQNKLKVISDYENK